MAIDWLIKERIYSKPRCDSQNLPLWLRKKIDRDDIERHEYQEMIKNWRFKRNIEESRNA